MAAAKGIRKSWLWPGFKFLPVLILWTLLSGCGVTPYKSEFSCPPTYGGICESPVDAYRDSVHGIDPRKFDPEWQKKRKKWEEKHRDLLEARKRAAGEATDTPQTTEAPGYRARLFEELKDLIGAPETPVLLPPRVMRALVLGTPDGRIYVAPHYVFFMLDEPRWVLRKIPEREVPYRKPRLADSEGRKVQEAGKDGKTANRKGKEPKVSN